MTLKQLESLKVGDILEWKDPQTNSQTLEMVTREWDKRSVRLKTIAIIANEEDDVDIGEEGWIHQHNCENLEKIA